MAGQPQSNDVLRQLMAEHGLTLESLAEAVNIAIWHLTGGTGACSGRHVHRWVSGEVAWPWSRSRHALEKVFGRPAHELGFRPPAGGHHAVTVQASSSPPNQDQPVDRRKFVVSLTGTLLPALPASGRLGMTDVARIRRAAAKLDALDDVYGGDMLVDVTDRYIGYVRSRMLQCTYGPHVEGRLYQVLGELQTNAGWFAYDAGMQDTAGRFWDGALRTALLARDNELQARIMSVMALQACGLKRGGDAVAIARTALDLTRNRRAPRLSALLHTRVAYGHSVLGEATRSGQSLLRAEQAFDRVGDQSPPWLAFCGPDELMAQTSLCHESLGQHRKAVELRLKAISLRPAKFRRNQFVGTAHLAECFLTGGDPERAVDAGHRALDMLADVHSSRGRTRLARFRRDISEYPISVSREFTERYDAVTKEGQGESA